MRKAEPVVIAFGIAAAHAAIAAPDFFEAVNRAREKETMADMRTIGTA